MAEFTDQSTTTFVEISEGPLETRLHVNEAGDGPTVVMIHGGGPGATGWSNFYRNIGPFVDAGFRVLLPDCPGFGQSDPLVSGERRDVLFSQAVVGLLDRLGIDKAHLVGNSLGGAAAMTCALDYPDRVDRLVVMGPAALGSSLFTPTPMEGIKRMMRASFEPSMEALRELIDVFVHDPSQVTEELIEGRFASMMRNDAEHLSNMRKSMELVMQDPSRMVADLSPRLGEIRAKTLATHGLNDRFVPLDHGLKVVAGIPDCRLVVFNGCGHWVQWEHADEFNRIVTQFLSS